jgi:tagatose-1,6-bisphosphate aldolase non-catalytic subunit AgaZ/GatZ
MLEKHCLSALHKLCVASAHALRMEPSVERALVSNNELLIKLWRTAIHQVDIYGSLLGFEPVTN